MQPYTGASTSEVCTFNELADQLVDVCDASGLFDLLKGLLIGLGAEREGGGGGGWEGKGGRGEGRKEKEGKEEGEVRRGAIRDHDVVDMPAAVSGC